MASFFAFIERVTTEAGNIPGNFSANFSVFSSSQCFSITLGSTVTFSPAKPFTSFNDIPSTGNNVAIYLTGLNIYFMEWDF